MIDISQVSDERARDFLGYFLKNREINRDFYRLVPEKDYDFRMVDNEKVKSDSVRESLAHQVAVEETYLEAVRSGTLNFKAYDDTTLKKLSKSKLLYKLVETDKRMVNMLADESYIGKKVVVPWSETPIDVVDMLWALDSHETLHTGWNLAAMDHLGMERFRSLKEMWGE